MKKIIALALACLMLCSLFAGCGSKSAGGLKTVEEGKLIMSTNAAFPPYEMTTDDGGFEGIDIEIAAAIAEKLVASSADAESCAVAPASSRV